ncbi:MAG TPA: VTT domain-containing protein [Bryobacteraceae bacterium]|jgi:membrane protein YqaA with SNARE-associated domain|nr:VTT domain-containing protein [Bryobacteraceae bacterium]
MHFWHHIVDVLLTWGPYGLLVLSALDSLGLPVIGGVDGLLIAVATNEPPKAYFAAACAVLGSMIGSLILFALARKGGEVLLAKHISGKMGARLHLWFQRYGLVTVFIPAISPLPLPMKIPVFCAGALNVRITYFLFVILVARVIRYSALAYLGKEYGRFTVRYLLSHGVLIGLVALGLAVLVAVGLRFYQRHKANVGEPE